MSDVKPLTREECEFALTRVAEWMGMKYFDGPPCPTGQAAAYRARGPMLVMDFEGIWVQVKTPGPAIIVEGIPGADWANWAASELVNDFAQMGIYAEPATGYALSLVRINRKETNHVPS